MFFLIISVTRFGVSAENVVATIDTPSNHHGISLPDRKKSFALRPAFLEAQAPIASVTTKNRTMIIQSREDKFIVERLY